MRFLLVLFISISIFLAGMVFGGNQQTKVNSSPIEIVEEIAIPIEAHVVEAPSTGDPSQMNLTQKVASILEGTVTGLYDFIVMVMYEIASIFFSIA